MSATTDRRIWRPTPRQAAVYEAIRQAPAGSLSLIGYGGAVGGGKTRLLAELAVDLALTQPGARILVARQHWVHLQTTTLQAFDGSPRAQALTVGRYDSQPIWRDIRHPEWPSGVTSRIYWRGLADWQSIGSEEYGWALIDEAHETTLEAALFLLSRLRHTASPKRGLVAGFNPWASWPVSWWMDGELPADLPAAVRAAYVPARIADNPYLPEGYEAGLRALYPETMVRRLIEGEAGVVEDAIYSQLSRDLHWKALEGPQVWSEGALGVDYGDVHPHAVVAVSRSSTGRLWVRETWCGHDYDALFSTIDRMCRQYRIRRICVDPMLKGWERLLRVTRADASPGSRRHRIEMVSRLLNRNIAGQVGLILDAEGKGNDELYAEMMGYHYVRRQTETRDEMEVARVNDNRVAALEYAVGELEGHRTLDGLERAHKVVRPIPRRDNVLVR